MEKEFKGFIQGGKDSFDFHLTTSLDYKEKKYSIYSILINMILLSCLFLCFILG